MHSFDVSSCKQLGEDEASIVIQNLEYEVFNENKIDFDKLQNVLGNYIDTDEEKYRFTWNGKMNALRLSQTPSVGTLRPCKEESRDWDTTQNLYIEGDNLEVLKLLQNSYLNKIKMIYIDPPYNTGNCNTKLKKTTKILNSALWNSIHLPIFLLNKQMAQLNI